MNRVPDERVAFYLKHQQRIEEWAALAPDAQSAAQQFLRSCEPDLLTLAATLGPDLRSFVSLDEPWPKLFVCRSEWLTDADSSKSPWVAIGLEWQATEVTFGGHKKSAYSGVWVNEEAPGGPQFRATLNAAFRDAGLPSTPRLEWSNEWWPVYRWEPAQGDYWDDLRPYRSQLVDAVQFFWKNFEPTITSVVSK
jgi:hypothetical protein